MVLAALSAQAADRPENLVKWRDGLASSAQPNAGWLATVAEQRYDVVINLAPPQSMGSIANEGGIVGSTATDGSFCDRLLVLQSVMVASVSPS